MFINADDVQRVVEGADAVAVIQRSVDLKKAGGSNWKGLCPFHSEKTPSFSVSQDKGLYYCFGCKASGNVVTFLREIEHFDFPTAIEHLAQMQGVQLRYEGGGDSGVQARNKKLKELLGQAAKYYHQQLMESEMDGSARTYLRTHRGYNKEVVVKYQIGYAPRGRSQLAEELLGNVDGATPELLKLANLVFLNEPSGTGTPDAGTPDAVDRFRDRVMFPIKDVTGATVGFGGRQLPGGRDPKYLNSAQTPVYDKSGVLYGLDIAKRSISTQGFVLLCEGYTDVTGFAIVGLENAVATCGTAVTEKHVELLAKFTQRILLAFDSDEAGRKAVEAFNRWIPGYGLDVSVVEFATGEDPGQLAVDNPDALHRAVDEARPFLEFLTDRIFGRHDLGQPMTRGRAAGELALALAIYPAALLAEADVAPMANRLPMETADFMALIGREREQLEREDAHRTQLEAGRAGRSSGVGRTSWTGRSSGAGRSSGVERAASGDGQTAQSGIDYYEPPEYEPPEYETGRAGLSGYSDGHSSGGYSAARPRREASSVPALAPDGELVALWALDTFHDEVAVYLGPEMFTHPITQAAYGAINRRHSDGLPSGSQASGSQSSGQQPSGQQPPDLQSSDTRSAVADNTALVAYETALAACAIRPDSESDPCLLVCDVLASVIKRESAALVSSGGLIAADPRKHDPTAADPMGNANFRREFVPALKQWSDWIAQELRECVAEQKARQLLEAAVAMRAALASPDREEAKIGDLLRRWGSNPRQTD